MMHLIRKPLDDFSLYGYHRGSSRIYTREDLLGHWSVLFFYPADFSYVCPTELKDLHDHFEGFAAENCEIFSVSTDTHLDHEAWAESSDEIRALPFVMLADPDGVLCRRFGILEDGKALRATFLLDPDGRVALYEVQDMAVGRNAAELLRKVQAARFVAEHGDRFCPAAWKPGEETLTPALDLHDGKSRHIDADTEAHLSILFEKLNSPVEIFCIAGNDRKSSEMRAFLNHMASLSPLLTVRFLSPGEDAGLDDALDASLLPATGVGGPLPRMVFHGIPGGKEIAAFTAAILNAGNAARELNPLTRLGMGRIRIPMKLQVFASLTCQHCCQMVTHAQRIAWENPQVTAHMIDASLYPDLAKSVNLARVPLTVVNGAKQIHGGRTLAELTALLAIYRD